MVPADLSVSPPQHQKLSDMFDSSAIIQDFPLLLAPRADGRRLCYLDSGATTQKPRSVIEAEKDFYEDQLIEDSRFANQE